jgi:hypothetical protein
MPVVGEASPARPFDGIGSHTRTTPMYTITGSPRGLPSCKPSFVPLAKVSGSPAQAGRAETVRVPGQGWTKRLRDLDRDCGDGRMLCLSTSTSKE